MFLVFVYFHGSYWIDTGEQDSIMVIFAFFFLALMGFFISDRYILEKELEFYMKKIQGKKGRPAGVLVLHKFLFIETPYWNF